MITGAASGIGRATALLLSEMGAKVLLADINADNLQKVKAECENETDTLVVDLTDTESIKNLVKEKVSTFGKLHGFVHCVINDKFETALKQCSAIITAEKLKVNRR